MLKLLLIKDLGVTTASVEGRLLFWYCIFAEPVESRDTWLGRVVYRSSSFSAARLTFHVAISSSPIGVMPLLKSIRLRRYQRPNDVISTMPTMPNTILSTMTSVSWPEVPLSRWNMVKDMTISLKARYMS
jgi:hypothetical protein